MSIAETMAVNLIDRLGYDFELIDEIIENVELAFTIPDVTEVVMVLTQQGSDVIEPDENPLPDFGYRIDRRSVCEPLKNPMVRFGLNRWRINGEPITDEILIEGYRRFSLLMIIRRS